MSLRNKYSDYPYTVDSGVKKSKIYNKKLQTENHIQTIIIMFIMLNKIHLKVLVSNSRQIKIQNNKITPDIKYNE